MNFYKNDKIAAILKNRYIKKLARQLYSKLLKVPFKHFNLKKNVTEFYTHVFKDFKYLSPMQTLTMSG